MVVETQKITGLATTESLIYVANTVLNKPGGYLSNDIFPPGIWLDNIPNWGIRCVDQVARFKLRRCVKH